MPNAQEIREQNEVARKRFDNGPVLRKRMVVAHVIGGYKNGPSRGVLDAALLKRITDNFKKYPRQVPIYALGDHVKDLDERMPDGWVEDVEFGHDGLIVEVKLHGRAVGLVVQDLVRGASIGVVPGQDTKGRPIGHVFHHLLLTNSPFIKDLPSIAASQVEGAETVASFFTALQEPNMATQEELAACVSAHLADPDFAAKDGMTKDETAAAACRASLGMAEHDPEEDRKDAKLKNKENELIELKASNLRKEERIEELEARLANASADVGKEKMAIENINLRRSVFAMRIKAVVDTGLKGGTLKASWCDGFAGKGAVDDEGTIRWLKASRFYDATLPDAEDQAFRILKFTAENNPPLYKVGGTFKSGAPAADAGTINLSQEQKDGIRKLGINPERISAMSDDTDYEAWQKLKAADGGK